jgi:hypothetical protein
MEGKGEFLSEELKKLLREIEVVQGLRAGALGKEIEARLRGVTEPSVERLKEALREEFRQARRKIPCPEEKRQCWRKAGRSHHDGNRGRSRRDPEAGRGP